MTICVAIFLVADIYDGLIVVGELWRFPLILKVCEARDRALSLTGTLVCETGNTRGYALRYWA